MPRTRMQHGNFLHNIGNRQVRQGVNALSYRIVTGYEQTTAAGAATGLNGPNRVRNSATLFLEPNLTIELVGNTTYLVEFKLGLALTAAQGIKFDFNGGTLTNAAAPPNGMGGVATFWTTGSNNSGTAIGATNAVPFNVAITALNTSIDGSTNNTWTSVTGWFTAQITQTGTLGFEFGQSSAGASNTDILPGSYIIATPLDYIVEN